MNEPGSFITAPHLRIAREELRELEQWAAQECPLEACGLLLGRSEEGATRVLHVRRVRNMQSELHRFELHPADHLACEDEARALGLEVVGVWHSHPERAPVPSELDRETAWARWSYLIVAVHAHGACAARSWRLVDGRFGEEALEIGEAPR